MGGRPNYGPTAQERTKRFLEALLAYANDELEGSERLQIEANWQTENKLVVRTKVRFLEELTAKYQQNSKLDTEQIKEALKRLKDWLEILEDNRTKTQGSEDWHFTLKLWSKDKQENLKQFEFEWESRRAKKSKPTADKVRPNPPKNPSQPEGGIDWRRVCQAMRLAQNQGRLTSNPLTTGDGVAFELDEIYVPLGLVERKQRDRRSGDVSPEQGSKVYEPEAQDEIVQTFQQDQFFEQVLRQGRSRRIAIIGEPGAGKTTLLQKIAAWILDNTSDVPIWISLADLQGKSLEQYLLQDWLKAATRKVRVPEAMQEALGELFNSGGVWLLLDAVDEMAVGATIGGLPLQGIANQLTGWVSDARVVLTCRLNVWDAGKNALEAFDTYRNLDFSYGDAQTPDQVGQFIRRWFKGSPARSERLRAELDQPGRERIKDAVKNPLRLALLCRAWSLGQGELPNTKAGLYQQFTDALYEWKQDRFPTSSSQRQELNKALGELALRAIASEKTKFRLRHRLVCSVLGKPDEELFQLALQLGWLNQVGVAAEAENRGEKVYAFYHPTFQEYFAAQAISDWHYFLNHTPHNPGEGTYRIFEPQWKEVILLWLGREDVPHDPKEKFIKALVEFKDGCTNTNLYGNRAYLLAAAAIREFENFSCADEIVAEILKWAFGYFDVEKQTWLTFLEPDAERAKAALEETDLRRVLPALVQIIRSTKNESTRRQAIYSLGKIGSGNPEAIATLVKLIKSTQDESTRRQAASSLREIGSGNKIAITALVELIELTENEITRRQVVESLRKIDPGNEIAIAALVQLIESTQDEDTRWLAASSLGKIDPGNETAIATLVQLIESTQDEGTRWLAASGLGKIDPGNETAITTLVQLIESTQDEDTRRRAVYSLGGIGTGNETAITTLVQLIESTQDKDTRRQAASSLREIGTGNETAIAALVQLIESTQHKSARRQAVYSLGEIGTGNEAAIATLVQLIKSTKNESIRRQAASSLGKIDPGNETAIATLVQLIESTQDEFTRWRAVESLGKIDPGNEIAVAALVQLLQSTQALVQLIESTKNEFIRRQAASSLGKIDPGNETAIATLVQLLQSTQDKSTRWQVASILGEISTGNEIAIAALVQLLQSTQDESIRRQAADSLKKILLDDQFAGIITALKDYLSDKTYENDFGQFRDCYKLIWHCAQNMTYPAFYQAWHTQPTPIHPEVLEITPVGSTPFTPSLNLAKLPQTLAAAIANDPALSQNIHLICIDGSKFIDRDNPAAKIYAQMVKSGCPKCEDGTPKTMPEFQTYWDLLQSDKRVVLVFYEGTPPNLPFVSGGSKGGGGFSESFLDALSKVDGAICVITTQGLDNMPLKCIKPSQPIAEVVEWLKKVVLEA
jgi:HEAT repeat protein